SLVCEIPEFHGFPKVEGSHREAKYNPKQDSHFGTQAVYDTPVCLFVQPLSLFLLSLSFLSRRFSTYGTPGHRPGERHPAQAKYHPPEAIVYRQPLDEPTAPAPPEKEIEGMEHCAMLLAVFDLPPIVLVPPAPISRPSNPEGRNK